MKFIVTSTVLLKALQKIAGVVGSNSVLATLEDFLFEVNGKTLTITATDLETMMRIQIDINEAQGDGSICIPAKILLEHLKGLPELPIAFTIDPKELIVRMQTDLGQYKVGGATSNDFPKAPEETETTAFTIPSAALIDCINKTLFATSNDTLRPAMTGILFELAKKSLNCVSTDAHRLVRFQLNNVAPGVIDSFVVPKKPLQQLKANLPADDTQLEVSYNASHMFIQSGPLSVCCRLIDARFPDYKVIIPTDSPYLLTINRADLAKAMKRINVFANKTTNQVVLDLKGNSLQLSAQDIDFSYEGQEKLPCTYEGEDMKIAFNAKLMVEMVSNLESTDVQLELSTPTRAGILRPVETVKGEDHLMLLMPLMIGV